MSDASAPVKEGDVLAGKFRVERVLGCGGMGVVVAAHHLQLDERVALKFLHGEAMQRGEIVARFAREARAAAKIKSEHVARVLDVGAMDDGAPYMVMEFLEGSDLAHVLSRGAPPVVDVVGWILQACEALAEAHALGIVHRDLKPANLFLARQPARPAMIKVLDFGISKAATGSEDQSLTATSAVMGSPLYMSPEQLASAKSVDQRSDIWSLGVILHEMFAGRPPFTGDAVTELIAHILTAPPAPLAELRPDLPPGLCDVVARCLEKDRTRRFENVAELARALEPFADPRVSHVSIDRIERVFGTGAASTSERPSMAVKFAPTEAWGGTQIEPKKSGGTTIAIVAVAALVVGGGALWFATRDKGAVKVNVTESPATTKSLEPTAPTTASVPTDKPPGEATTTSPTAVATPSASAASSASTSKISTGKTKPIASTSKPMASTNAVAPPSNPTPPPANPPPDDWKK